jgi:hypothetical protein
MITTRSFAILTSTPMFVSRLGSLMASAFLLGTSSLSNAGVVAAPLNGVVSGLSVVWNNTNTVQIQPGEAYVTGHQFTLAAAANIGLTGGANTAYYVYLTFDRHTGTFLLNPWVIVPIAPANNGIGAGIVNGPGDACDAIFLGSLVTDSLSNLVPFVRSGEEVILALEDSTCPIQTLQGAGEAGLVFVPGNVFGQTMVFDSVTTQSCNGTNNGGADQLVLPYPLTASAALIDFQLTNTDNNIPHYLFVQYSGLVPPQAQTHQLTLYSQPNDWVQYYPMTRVNPVVVPRINNHNNPTAAPFFPEFVISIDQTPAAGKTVTVSAYYRGYVESIGHLTQE